MTTAELRKLLKQNGYSLKLKTFSIGTSATVVHIETQTVLGNVESVESAKKWHRLFEVLEPIRNDVETWGKSEKVFGVKTWFDNVPTIG